MMDFLCLRCGKCCQGDGYVWVTIEEMEKIAQLLSLEFHYFAAHYIKRVASRYSLRDKHNQECIFWSDTGCQIYNARPEQCRTFPNWDKSKTIDPKTIDTMWKNCPGIQRLKSLSEK
ncbi:MAG: YkgJ family cysteine cluster protein [Candidatus Brocadiae bacterium]|nr:YkgJ family cysteine cluster protein [Candidatus Brocadiia bacterium]